MRDELDPVLTLAGQSKMDEPAVHSVMADNSITLTSTGSCRSPTRMVVILIKPELLPAGSTASKPAFSQFAPDHPVRLHMSMMKIAQVT